MDKLVLKPSFSKILSFWLLMSAVILILLLVVNWVDFSDPLLFLIVLGGVLLQCFLFCIIFFSLPYFRIEVTETTVSGPSGWGWGWQRADLEIREVDLRNVNTRLQWLGFYMLRSRGGAELSVWGFSADQFIRLVDALARRRSVQA